LCADTVDAFASLHGVDYVIWGTGRVAGAFYQKYCVERALLHPPLFFCDNAAKEEGQSSWGDGRIIPPKDFFSLSARYYLAGKPLAVIIGATGEQRLYGNLLLTVGVRQPGE